ncbi:uncharacterized protein VTP21DRAFT_11426 [Calcarisporiella thermophila]|uniref:uncharacterized protein n=1 Tax=Calcarisporiella thermophila TaxID=911321 RepID=UPI00374349A6
MDEYPLLITCFGSVLYQFPLNSSTNNILSNQDRNESGAAKEISTAISVKNSAWESGACTVETAIACWAILCTQHHIVKATLLPFPAILEWNLFGQVSYRLSSYRKYVVEYLSIAGQGKCGNEISLLVPAFGKSCAMRTLAGYPEENRLARQRRTRRRRWVLSAVVGRCANLLTGLDVCRAGVDLSHV